MAGSAGEAPLPEALLMAAADAGDVATVSRLLDEGVDVAWQDGEGKSALMAAAEAGSRQVVAALLEAGCPWNLQDNEGFCAGDYAARNPELVQLIMEWGVQAEMVLGEAERARIKSQAGASPSGTAVNAAYLQQRLHFTEDGTKLLDADGEAVMMGWEGPLMVRHAAIICADGGDVLNIGFGLGLVDDAIQAHGPASHTIIEAHPDVHAHAVARGWGDKPGVHLLLGRWQDVVPRLLAEGRRYSGVFIDTYGEFYGEMYDFHRMLPKLLKPGGIYSFFNGFASDHLFFHAVYGRLIQLELQGLGLDTSYERVAIEEAVDPAVWEGVKNKYWKLPFYFVPTCVLRGGVDGV